MIIWLFAPASGKTEHHVRRMWWSKVDDLMTNRRQRGRLARRGWWADFFQPGPTVNLTRNYFMDKRYSWSSHLFKTHILPAKCLTQGILESMFNFKPKQNHPTCFWVISRRDIHHMSFGQCVNSLVFISFHFATWCGVLNKPKKNTSFWLEHTLFISQYVTLC